MAVRLRPYMFSGLPRRGEYCLAVDVPGGDHGAGGREALGEEDRGELALGPVAKVALAVLEAGDLELDALGGLLGLLLHHVELGAELLVGDDLLLEALGRGGVAPEIVVEAALDLLHDPGLDVGVAELVLGLALENGILELDGHGRGHALAHVLAPVGGLEELVDGLEDALPEGREVGTPVRGVLAVDEAEVFLAIVTGVGEGELDAVRLVVADIVHRAIAHLVLEEVEEAVGGGVFLAVELEDEAGVEVGIVPGPALDEFHVVGVIPEYLGVGDEFHEGPVLLLGPALLLRQEAPPLEDCLEVLALAVGDDPEAGREGVDCLRAHAVEAHGELEDIVVVLGPPC